MHELKSAETLPRSPVEVPSPNSIHHPVRLNDRARHHRAFGDGQLTSDNNMGAAVVATLPSTTYDRVDVYAQSPPVSYPQPHSLGRLSLTSPPKRPRLSLNTQCSTQPALPKGNSTLRLDSLSATSPTHHNTHHNAYILQTQSAPTTPLGAGNSPPSNSLLAPLPQISMSIRTSSPIVSNLSPDAAFTPREHQQATRIPQLPIHTPPRTTSSSSISSTASTASSPAIPYTRTPTIRSCLTNSPLPPPPMPFCASPIGSTGTQRPRLLFPPLKARKVAFRTPLSEEVRNVRFTWKCSDIQDELEVEGDKGIDMMDIGGNEEDTAAVMTPNEKQEPDGQEETKPETAETPTAIPPSPSRKKRRREDQAWVWTLGPSGAMSRSPD